MRISGINPFIRYASISNFVPTDNTVCSYDSRLFYILAGSGSIMIGSREYAITPKTLMLWRAGTKYRFRVSRDIRMIILNFDFTQQSNSHTDSIPPVIASKFDSRNVTQSEEFEDCKSLNEPIVLENMQKYKIKLNETIEIFATRKIFRSELASAVLKGILTEIAVSSSYSETKSLNKLDIILEYIKNNYNKNITNEELGRIIGYHSYYVNRLMLKHTGTTLRQYLINYRIETAKELLTHSSKSISEISDACGFHDPAYFSNQLKSITGLSPSEYRKEYKNII